MGTGSIMKAFLLTGILLSIYLDQTCFVNSYLYRVNPETDFYDTLQEFIQERQLENEMQAKSWPKSIEEDLNWPKTLIDSSIKQISGVNVAPDGNIYVFHRARRSFDLDTFDTNNVLTHKDQGPIPNDTLLVYDENGNLLKSWGKNIFYMPHSVTVDSDGNMWFTDVGLHQVLKFKKDSENPSLTLGEALVPGSDDLHFCKPTDVKIASNKMFFVSDGYCNSRIMMFRSNGSLMNVIGTEEMMLIPHGLALDEVADRICVADRENYRVLCFPAGLSKRIDMSESFIELKMGHVYAVALADERLFAVNGKAYHDQGEVPEEAIVVTNLETQSPSTKYYDQNFQVPHAVSVAPNKKALYVVDLDGDKKLYKMKLH